MRLGVEEAVGRVVDRCLVQGAQRRIGVELEWLVNDVRDAGLPVDPHRLAAVLPDDGGLTGQLSIEPGGQLELSSRPAGSLSLLVAEVSADMAALRTGLDTAGLRLTGAGADPCRPPVRVRQAARYAAMEEFFDCSGPEGRIMMCGTASVQINLDAGLPGDGPAGIARRWRVAHAIGPVLVASFANSPRHAGSATGWKSTRQAVWGRLDPSRCAPPAAAADPRLAWAEYALRAQVMCVRGPVPWSVPDGLTFRDWLGGAGPRPATVDDLDYHLTTLFPPVRPRGWLELRMVDAQPGEDGWIVPLAVAAALVEDGRAGERALAATEGYDPFGTGPWLLAAREGVADAGLRAAAVECFEAAMDGLRRLGAPDDVRAAVELYADRYVLRGRCPADDDLAPAGHGQIRSEATT